MFKSKSRLMKPRKTVCIALRIIVLPLPVIWPCSYIWIQIQNDWTRDAYLSADKCPRIPAVRRARECFHSHSSASSSSDPLMFLVTSVAAPDAWADKKDGDNRNSDYHKPKANIFPIDYSVVFSPVPISLHDDWARCVRVSIGRD